MSQPKVYKGDIVKDYIKYVKEKTGENFDPNDPDNQMLITLMKDMVDNGLVHENDP